MDSTLHGVQGRRAEAGVPWRAILFGVLLVTYLLLMLAVAYRSPVISLDRDILHLDLRRRWPGLRLWVLSYEYLGQRGPATLAALPWFIWQARRQRSGRPLIMLALGLILLNGSVGVVKLAVGRVGPRSTHHPLTVFHGGDIFPSGHTSNAVVLYGLIAWIALSHRRVLISAAVFVSLTVGLGTIYLDTHWFSDVLGGWIAGGLVLLALPTVLPTSERWVASVTGRIQRWRARRRGSGAARGSGPPDDQPKPTPASSTAASHGRAASAMPLDARDEPTRCG